MRRRIHDRNNAARAAPARPVLRNLRTAPEEQPDGEALVRLVAHAEHRPHVWDLLHDLGEEAPVLDGLGYPVRVRARVVVVAQVEVVVAWQLGESGEVRLPSATDCCKAPSVNAARGCALGARYQSVPRLSC